MSERADNTKATSAGGSSVAILLIALFILLPLLYVLSVGPAVLLLVSTGSDDTVFNVVYFPLVWLHGNDVPVIAPMLEAYVKLWVGEG